MGITVALSIPHNIDTQDGQPVPVSLPLSLENTNKPQRTRLGKVSDVYKGNERESDIIYIRNTCHDVFERRMSCWVLPLATGCSYLQTASVMIESDYQNSSTCDRKKMIGDNKVTQTYEFKRSISS